MPRTETNNEPLIVHHFLGGVSQPPGGRLITVTASIMEGTALCSYWANTFFSIYIDFPFLLTMLLSKPLYVDLQNTLSTVMVFSIVLLLPKELILQPVKYSDGLLLMDFPDLTMFPITLKQLTDRTVDWPFCRYSYGTSWGNVLQDKVYALNGWPRYSALSLIARIHGFLNQRVEMGMDSLLPLVKLLLFVSASLDSSRLEDLDKKEICPPLVMIPLTWTLELPPDFFGLFMLGNQQEKKGNYCASIGDWSYQGEIDGYCTREERESTLVCLDAGDLLGHLLVLQCPVIKINGKWQQPSTCWSAGVLYPWEIKMGLPHQVRNFDHLNMLIKGKGNIEWTVEEGKHQLWPYNQLQKWWL